MSNQACKARPKVINVNSNNPIFILLVLKQVSVVTIEIILMIHMQKCVADVIKNLSVKVFNLISRTNETRHIK